MNVRGQLLYRALILVFGSCTLLQQAIAGEIMPNANASLEGKVDIREEDKGKWLPVPIPISNPTVGTGLQGVLLYLHAPKAGDSAETPAATSGIGGMYTDSESKVLGVFHDNHFADDRFRLKAMVGVGDLNLDFFGIGTTASDLKITYNIRPKISYLQFLVELPRAENHYLGLSHLYSDAELRFRFEFELDPENPVSLPGLTFNSVTSSLGIVYNYDSRDNNFYPRKGANISVSYTSDDERWGSEYRFERLNLNYRHFVSLSHNQVLATQLNFSDVDGDPPFYFLSSLAMRGFAGGRYLDNTSGSAHIEWRYKFSQRWGVNIFGETGRIGESLDELFDSRNVNSAGLGLRWQPIVSKELNLGIDVAKSTDDSALYLRVGEAF
ncbi:surface antigen-like protein [Alteromonadaceae bacterium 2753L.S.0a.02]|nr:surface antigen-like protein [Alteromonadaceae bacterium 2753L.S.0a.02]